MWLYIFATLMAFFIKGLCGFANTLVFTSILGFGVSNVNISPLELVLGYPTNVILTWKNRKNLNPKIFVPLSLLVLAGSIPGAVLLKNVNAQAVKIIFGVVVILVGIEMLLREVTDIKFKESKVVAGIVGLLAGVMCGLFGVGVVLAAYVSRITDSDGQFKANLSAVFIVDNTFRVILYTVMGVITAESMRMSGLLMPFMLIGLFAGMKSSQVLDEKLVKRLVIVLLIISGIVLIVKNVAI